MTKRTSPKSIESFDDLGQLQELVVDKRLSKRSEAKKNRRNRHYEKLLIKAALNQKSRDPGTYD